MENQKTCPKCGQTNAILSPNCAHCGYKFPKETDSVSYDAENETVKIDTKVPSQCGYCNYARITKGIDECMHPEENGRELPSISAPPPAWCPLRRGFDGK